MPALALPYPMLGMDYVACAVLDLLRNDPLIQLDTKGRIERRNGFAGTGELAYPTLLVCCQAVTEEGQLVVTSASGSQIGPYASGAGRLILVIGSQKIVPDLATAFRRIEEHVFPWEDARLREQMGMGTMITRTLIIERDFYPGRTTVVLVREPIGV